MKKTVHKMTGWMMLALCLLLPTCALGVTEGVVEDAPMVAVDGVRIGETAAEVSYLPEATLYTDYGDWTPAWENAEEWAESAQDEDGVYYEVEQRPRLTPGEAARAKALLEKVRSGELAYTGESVLGKMEDVVVGVYTLDPEDYDGERAYVLLPGPCMTDGQLLALIDAFDQLGLVFDPEALSYRNCARGGGIECSRFLTEEERGRYTQLAELIERGLLDVTKLNMPQAIQPKLDSRYYCGLEDFTLRPYRAISDEELCAMLVETGVQDLSKTFDFDAVEKKARAMLYERLGCPLSMTLSGISYEGGYVPMLFDADGGRAWEGDARGSYGAAFEYQTPEGIKVYANATFDAETNEVVSLSVMHDNPLQNWKENPSLSQEAVAAAVKDAEETLGLEGLTWRLREETCSTNWGECAMVNAQVKDDLLAIVYIGLDDGQVHGLSLERGALVEKLPGEEEPVNG